MPSIIAIIGFFGVCVAMTFRSIRDLSKHVPKVAPATTSKKVNPKLETALGYASRLYAEKKFLAAEKAYLEVIKIDHKNVIAYNRLGRIYLWLKNYADAIECCQITVQLEPSASTYFNLGSAYYENKNYTKSIAAFAQALALEPSANRYYALGKAYQRRQDWPRATQAFENAVALDPSRHNQQALLNAYRTSNNLEKARQLQLELSKTPEKIV